MTDNLVGMDKVLSESQLTNIASRPFKKNEPTIADVVIDKNNAKNVNHFYSNPNHGRDITLQLDSENTHAVWADDEYPDILYGDTTIKGNVMDPTPYVESDPYTTIHTIGLLDKKFINRISTVSRFMRKNGLPTERPREIKLLNEIIVVNGDKTKNKIDIDHWKAKEIERIKNLIFIKSQAGENTLESETLLKNTEVYFKNVEFVSMTRDVQINTRLEDIMRSIKKGEIKQTMEPIFKWINTVMKVRNKGLIPGTARVESFTTSNNDLIRYFSNYYPSNAGIYLGIMRKLEISSGYLHPGNWQGVPTILDLDSVHGKGIFSSDSAPTIDQFATDAIDTSNNFCSIFEYDFERNKTFGDVDYESLSRTATFNFFDNYFRTAFGKKLSKIHVNQFFSSKTRNNFGTPDIQIPVLNRMSEKLPMYKINLF